MSIVINDLNNTDNNEINISDLSSNEIDKIFVNDIINIPLVKGETGNVGPKGDSNTLTIGTVEKGEEASATITGEAPNQILNLVLPKGDQGIQGVQGPPGESYDDTEIKAEIQETNNKIENLSKTYKNSTITAPTIQGFGKIHKLFGKTEEIGSGEKSSSNPYRLECVADDVNLFDKNKLQIANAWQVTYSLNSEKALTINSTATSGVAFVKTNNLNLKSGTYTFSADVSGEFQEIRIAKSDGTRIKAISTKSDSFTVTEDTQIYFEIYVWATSTNNTMTIKNIQIEKGSQATEYKEYGEGSIKITSTDGTNTSNKVISCKPLCCLKDESGNILAQDYIDFDRQKIIRQCEYINSYNSENITTNYISSTGELTTGATVVYQLSQAIEEDIDITNSIVQYANETTISNSEDTEMEIELTNNKAISSINKNIAELQENCTNLQEKEKDNNEVKEGTITAVTGVDLHGGVMDKYVLYKVGKVVTLTAVINYNANIPSTAVKVANIVEGFRVRNNIAFAIGLCESMHNGWSVNTVGYAEVNIHGDVYIRNITATACRYAFINISYISD